MAEIQNPLIASLPLVEMPASPALMGQASAGAIGNIDGYFGTKDRTDPGIAQANALRAFSMKSRGGK